MSYSFFDICIACIVCLIFANTVFPLFVHTPGEKKVVRGYVSLVFIVFFIGVTVWHIHSIRNREAIDDDQIVTHFAENGEYR